MENMDCDSEKSCYRRCKAITHKFNERLHWEGCDENAESCSVTLTRRAHTEGAESIAEL